MDPSNPFLNVSTMLSCTAFCDMKTYELTFQDTERWVLPFVLDLATASFLWHRDFLFSSILLGYSWEKLCSGHPVSQDWWYSFLKGNKCWFQCKNIIRTYLQKEKVIKQRTKNTHAFCRGLQKRFYVWKPLPTIYCSKQCRRASFWTRLSLFY